MFEAIWKDTREGFRLFVAWVVGFLSFGVLSQVAERVIRYYEPWNEEHVATSEVELFLLYAMIGTGLAGLLLLMAREGIKPRHRSNRSGEASH